MARMKNRLKRSERGIVGLQSVIRGKMVRGLFEDHLREYQASVKWATMVCFPPNRADNRFKQRRGVFLHALRSMRNIEHFDRVNVLLSTFNLVQGGISYEKRWIKDMMSSVNERTISLKFNLNLEVILYDAQSNKRKRRSTRNYLPSSSFNPLPEVILSVKNSVENKKSYIPPNPKSSSSKVTSAVSSSETSTKISVVVSTKAPPASPFSKLAQEECYPVLNSLGSRDG